MLDSIEMVARQVGVLFALIAVGAACWRTRFLGESAVKGMVDLLMLVVTPCVIVEAFQRPFEPRLLAGLGWALGTAIAAHAIGIAVSMLLRPADSKRRSVLRFAVVFSNAGFMGLPLEHALLGGDGVFFGAVYVAVFNLVCWSYGLVLMSGGLKDMRMRTMLVNPGSIGIALGLPFFLMSWQLPPIIGTPVKMLADLNTPLAMIVIGYYLAQASFRTVLTDVHAHLACVLRLVLIPCVLLGTLAACRPPDPIMAVALVTASSAPVAALTTVFAVRYERDVATSVGLVSGSTLASILTMPPIIGLAMWIFGVQR